MRIFAVVAMVALALSVLTVTQVTRTAYAEKDTKTKRWFGDGNGAESTCTKHTDPGCSDVKDLFGAPFNKFLRNLCQEGTVDGKCKQAK